MATLVNDDQLAYELQELHIISNHWNADLGFIIDEIRFLKNALNKYRVRTHNPQACETVPFYKVLESQENVTFAVKSRIDAFVRFIELFIEDPKRQIGIDVIEKFTALGAEIESVSAYVKLIKSSVFKLIEDAIRAGKYAKSMASLKTATQKNFKSVTPLL